MANRPLMPPRNRGEEWLAAQAGLMERPDPENRGEEWTAAIIDHIENEKASLVNGKVPADQLPPMDYVPTEEKGAADGVATLDNYGKVPSGQLPSYVDDVLEFNSVSDFPEVGSSSVIYIAKDTNYTYRWSGDAYVQISGKDYQGGTGITVNNEEISVDFTTIQSKLAAGNGIRIENNVVSAEQMIFITDNLTALKEFLNDDNNVGKYVQWTGPRVIADPDIGDVDPYVLYGVEADD